MDDLGSTRYCRVREKGLWDSFLKHLCLERRITISLFTASSRHELTFSLRGGESLVVYPFVGCYSQIGMLLLNSVLELQVICTLIQERWKIMKLDIVHGNPFSVLRRRSFWTFAGRTDCPLVAIKLLGSFGLPYGVIDENHDLKGLMSFLMIKRNWNSFECTWTINSTIQLYGREDLVAANEWKTFVFTDAPPNGSRLHVLQENPCCQWMLLVESKWWWKRWKY